MYIHEASESSGATKKAIEYYCMKGLLSPQVSENGYRIFSGEDVLRLKKITLLRSLGASVEDIRGLIDGNDDDALRRIVEKQEAALQQRKEQNELLKELAASMDWDTVYIKAAAAESRRSVTERLTAAFPGPLGRILALHFGQFLQQPVRTDDQEDALREICAFLDGVRFEIPEEIKSRLEETDTEAARQISRKAEAALADAAEDPENWLKNNKEIIDRYLEFQKTAEYQSSPGARLMELLKKFTREEGYDSIFIPAMRRLSPAYDEYLTRLQKADQVFSRRYPQ